MERKLILEENAKDAPVKDVLWEANTIETEKVKIFDPGVGKEVILRHFFFKALPRGPLDIPPRKIDVINHYKRLIEQTLWGDGLMIREDKPIEVHTLKKAKRISPSLYQKMRDEGADFVILLLAEPRNLQTVHDIPHRAI